MAQIWNDWGFSKNPFENHALAPNDEGLNLLSGRDGELDLLTYLLENSNAWVPVSGNAGVGKTSLANVASYVLYKKSDLDNPPCVLFIPCISPISVKPKETDEDFKNRVATVVLNTLVKYRSDLERNNLYSLDKSLFDELDSLKTWASSPLTGGKGGGVAGVSASKTTSANTSSGYASSFADQLFSLNERFFSNGGGIVCIIDNCEVYPDAAALISVLSGLRDDLFLKKGLKWVFCGALGILERLADDRLTNFIGDNIVKLSPIESEEQVVEMINRRRNCFKSKPEQYLPVGNSEMTELFKIAGGNPRRVLAKMEAYCLWAGMPTVAKKLKCGELDIAKCFEIWRDEQIVKNSADYKTLATRKAWTIFQSLVEKGGDTRPSFYEQFDCNSVPSFIQHLNVLVSHGLVAKHFDDDDLRGTIYRVTDKGRWTIYAWNLSKPAEKLDLAQSDSASKLED
jgi:hypothetical protein